MNFYIASGFQNKHLVCFIANELKKMDGIIHMIGRKMKEQLVKSN
ncbi:hypothetical protein DJ93_1278 [Bacillus clarus]|uniref:Uncharacterized protein n=1 Tax=Bacillus clarus TaxID=2338372 RepID=A0A090Z2C1_9BACI|nr:hypothetical protein DJ93_1278 [Bacillus clarus]